jgi:hypothetical protein
VRLRPCGVHFQYGIKPSRHQNAGQNRHIKIASRSFEYVEQFKYLRTTITNQDLNKEEIKKRSNSGNACYRSSVFSSAV